MKTPFFFLALTVVVCSYCTESQWVLTTAPYGGNIACLAASPNGSGGTNLFAGTADASGLGGGIFRSTDNGASWTAANDGLPGDAAVSTILVDPYPGPGTLIFAGTGIGDSPSVGVFVSNNNGASWTPVNVGLPGHHYSLKGFQPIRGLAISPPSGGIGTSTLLVCTWNRGIYRSTDNGSSWMAANEGLPRYSYDTSSYDVFNCLAVAGTNIFAGTWQHGVFISTNSGASWTVASKGFTGLSIECLEPHGTDIFAGTQSGVFRSTDNGANWTAVNGGLPNGRYSTAVTSVLRLFSIGQVLLAGTPDHGIYRSTNNGMSWTASNVGLQGSYPDTTRLTAVGGFAASGQILFAGNGRRIYRSTDIGTSWSAASIALTNSACSINAFAVSDRSLFAGGADGLDVSTNQGESWTQVRTTYPQLYVHALSAIGGNLFLGRDQGLASFGDPKPLFPEAYGVFLSTDSGVTWTSTNTTSLWLNVYAFAISGTTLFAGTSHGVFVTTNNGTSWQQANGGLADTVVDALVIYPDGPKPWFRSLFAGTSRGVFRSSNDGADWTAVNTGLTDTSITALAANTGWVFAGTAHGLFLSMNYGIDWAPANDGLTDTNITCLLVNGTVIFAGTRDGGIFLSANNGTSWTSFNAGLPAGTMVNSLAVAGTNLLAGSWGCVWRRPLSEVTTSINAPTTVLPQEMSLGQNYPNPFNPTTKIQFTIVNTRLPHKAENGGQGQSTIVKVLDVLGRDVATLVNEVKEPGTYTVQFDARLPGGQGSSLATGVYFYRLQTGDFVQTKKLVILK